MQSNQDFAKMLVIFGVGFASGFLVGPKDGLVDIDHIFKLVREIRLQKGAWL